jgi:hypothetical protein
VEDVAFLKKNHTISEISISSFTLGIIEESRNSEITLKKYYKMKEGNFQWFSAKHMNAST